VLAQLPQARRCLLCGEPSDRHGIFTPNNPQAWGAPPGKVRQMLYALCARHATFAFLEEIERRLQRQGMAPWN
jgi:hypothetical protein